MPGRERVIEVEPCHQCRAQRGQKCRTYKGGGKAPCRYDAICARCAAQMAECRCGGPARPPLDKPKPGGVQLLLFGDGTTPA